MKRRRFLAQVAGLTVGVLAAGAGGTPPALAGMAGGDSVPGTVDLPTSREQNGIAGDSAAAAESSASAAGGVIYLTFDDGYVGTGDKLEALNALGVAGTFFLTGQAIAGNPRTMNAIVTSGHRLANHTYSHANLSGLSRSAIQREVQAAEDAAVRVTGVSTRPLFRPPWGATNAAVRDAVAALGFRTVLWDWDTLDWAGRSPAYIEARINQGVVLMHTQGRYTVAALYDLIPSLVAQGYSFGVL